MVKTEEQVENQVANEVLILHLIQYIMRGADIECKKGSPGYKALNRLVDAIDEDLKQVDSEKAHRSISDTASRFESQLDILSEEFREGLYELVHLIWEDKNEASNN